VNALVDATPIPAGVLIDAAVGLTRDRGADHVADGRGDVTLALGFAQGGQGVDGTHPTG